MARGSIAKEFVTQKICEIFGDKVVKVDGSKIYVNAQEGAEVVQVAIALTCPKTPVAASGSAPTTPSDDGFDFEAMGSNEAPAAAVITEEEENNLKILLAKLGL